VFSSHAKERRVGGEIRLAFRQVSTGSSRSTALHFGSICDVFVVIEDALLLFGATDILDGRFGRGES
jgi:hypothetical protein